MKQRFVGRVLTETAKPSLTHFCCMMLSKTSAFLVCLSFILFFVFFNKWLSSNFCILYTHVDLCIFCLIFLVKLLFCSSLPILISKNSEWKVKQRHHKICVYVYIVAGGRKIRNSQVNSLVFIFRLYETFAQLHPPTLNTFTFRLVTLYQLL